MLLLSAKIRFVQARSARYGTAENALALIAGKLALSSSAFGSLDRHKLTLFKRVLGSPGTPQARQKGQRRHTSRKGRPEGRPKD